MTLADMIPTLDDKDLANLRDNALRLEAGSGRQQQQAAEALPLIEAELAARLALKPPKKTAKPRVAKAAKAPTDAVGEAAKPKAPKAPKAAKASKAAKTVAAEATEAA